jgi:hypothetical protein
VVADRDYPRGGLQAVASEVYTPLYAGRQVSQTRAQYAQEVPVDRNRAWTLIESTRVATLGTVRREGSPHLVPWAGWGASDENEL